MALVYKTAAFIRALSRVWQHKLGFTAVALLVFSMSVGLLASLDLLPERKVATAETAPIMETAPVVLAPELPTKIEIPSIKLSTTIANPNTTDVTKLDEALHNGAVRYPLSSKLGAQGNVILFGHSSYLPVVNNQAYKAFNEIQKLTASDRIYVTGETHTYVYQVESVHSASATTDGIPLSADGQVLTLATCDSFGTKSDRFVVTARFVESYPNAS